MKKTLNEEISRIKSMMGCCKGNLNETIQPNPQQEAQMIQMFAQDIQELDITQDDLVMDNTASLVPVKQKIGKNLMDPFLQKAKREDLKALIKGLKHLKRNANSIAEKIKNQQQTNQSVDVVTNQGVNDNTKQPLNEQGLFDEDIDAPGNVLAQTFLEALLIWYLIPSAPVGGAIYVSLGVGPYIAIVATWLILSAFRCLFYDLFGGYETNNIVNKLIQIITVDLANLFSPDPYVRGCGIIKNY
jgi:hypothetical protein